MEYRAVVTLTEEIHLKIKADTTEQAKEIARSLGSSVDDLMFRSNFCTKAHSSYKLEIGDFSDIDFSKCRS